MFLKMAVLFVLQSRGSQIPAANIAFEYYFEH